MRTLHAATSIGIAILLAIGFSGCSATESGEGHAPAVERSNAADEAPDAGASSHTDARGAMAQGDATFHVGDRKFDVELSLCSVYENGEVLLSGAATESGTGAIGYLDGDATVLDDETYGEFRVDIGADGPLQSTDDFLALGNSMGGTFTLVPTADGYLITAPSWNSNGEDLGEASLTFQCN